MKSSTESSGELLDLAFGDNQATIENMHQFYDWFATVEEQGKAEEDKKYRCDHIITPHFLILLHSGYTSQVAAYRDCCNELLRSIDAALDSLRDLENDYAVYLFENNVCIVATLLIFVLGCFYENRRSPQSL